MKLISPWIDYYRKIQVLFEQDPEVKIIFDEENYEIKVFVEDGRKAEALTLLLPTEKEFGNVTVKIVVIPANDGKMKKADAIREAFLGNPALAYVLELPSLFGTFNYAVFQNKVVQYFNDDMRDINGNRSTLYQELAKEVFGEDAEICFCTEAVSEELSKPLGEWP